MHVKGLELKNFRNIEQQSIAFDDGINILYGENAQGKTNVLEALYLTATGKSQRTNNYHDMIKKDEQGLEIKMTAIIGERENQIDIRYYKEKGKSAEINGIKRDKISDILGTMNMIFFSPETLEIIKGSPLGRRRFLDILLCQVSKNYLFSLQQYNQVIKNKSTALKKGRADKKYDEIIPIWNEHISKHGGRIAATRDKAARRLNAFMKDEMLRISDGKEHSDLVYRTFTECPESPDEKYYVEQLAMKLEQGLKREKDMGLCLVGTHRDDMEIVLNGSNSRQFCSQGQQRSLALALVLAELRLIEEIKGEKPVLLLDDVMSELDRKRQEHLLKGLHDMQTIITTTDAEMLKGETGRRIRYFNVKAGKITG